MQIFKGSPLRADTLRRLGAFLGVQDDDQQWSRLIARESIVPPPRTPAAQAQAQVRRILLREASSCSGKPVEKGQGVRQTLQAAAGDPSLYRLHLPCTIYLVSREACSELNAIHHLRPKP